MESAVPARVDRVGTDPRTLLGPKLWRGHEQAQIKTEPTGYVDLDRALPGGGWPCGAVSEVLHAQPGVGELSLALPLLARLTQAGRPAAFIAPPMRPYAPRLAASGIQLEQLIVVEADSTQNALWSAEQLLRADAGGVMLWIDKVDTQSLRRLQLAAESSDSCVLIYRPERFAVEATPSALRLRVWRQTSTTRVEVMKCRGMKPAPVSLRAAA